MPNIEITQIFPHDFKSRNYYYDFSAVNNTQRIWCNLLSSKFTSENYV